MISNARNILLNRDGQRKSIKAALNQLTAPKNPFTFSALEFYGIGGLGKSRILDEAKRECRERKLAFAVIDFLGYEYEQPPGEGQKIDLLLRICDQFDHYLPLSAARSVLSALVRNHPSPESFSQHLVQFQAELTADLAGKPFILLLDSVEQCPDELFNWLGQTFLAAFANEDTSPTLVFLAGRGPRIPESKWPKPMIALTQSSRLDPLDFEHTGEQIRSLSQKQELQKASRQIFDLSSGHPYSTEVLVYELERLGVETASTEQQTYELARRLYDEVIRHYILSKDKGWILPFLQVACIPRSFNPGLLSKLSSRDKQSGQPPIQWYIARLTELQLPPWHLVYVTKQAYELDHLFRKLLHKSLAIIQPDEIALIHEKARDFYQEQGKTADNLLEVLYHTAEIIEIRKQGNAGEILPNILSNFLSSNFSPEEPQSVEELSRLNDLLKRDLDLQALLDKETFEKLGRIVQEFLNPAPVPAQDFQLSHLTIDFYVPSAYIVSWYHANQVVLSQETTHSDRRFALEAWKNDLGRIGQAAYKVYLPKKAQDRIRQNHDWAIQLSTNTTEIPWELLNDGSEFLCLSRPFGRKPKMEGEPQRYERVKKERPRALVIGDPDDDLSGARAESEGVVALLKKANWDVDEFIGKAKASADEFTLQVSNIPYDLIHFAGHGFYNSGNPKMSCIFFSDDKAVFAEEFERILCSPAFVFFSACKGAAAQTTPGNRGELMNGIAISTLMGGATGCIGPIWDIPDGAARDFALVFYQQVLHDSTIGEAVRLARKKVQTANPDTWASWVLYGDPLHKLLD